MRLQKRIYISLIILGSLVIAFLIPPFQEVDEPNHIFMVQAGIGNDSLFYLLEPHLHSSDTGLKIQPDERTSFETIWGFMTDKVNYGRSDYLPKHISPVIIKYLPSTVGMMLAVLLHLSPYWIMMLGRIFSLLFYVGICLLVYRLMPVKKDIMLLIMTLPMTLQQASAISYDCMLFAMSFLLVAYTLHLKYTAERVGWLRILAALAMIFIIGYIKPPYVLLGLMLLLIPADKVCLKLGKLCIDGEFIKKYRLLLIIAALLMGALGIYLVRDDFFVNLAIGMMLELGRTLVVFAHTFEYYWKFFLQSIIGSFGFCDSAVPMWFVYISWVFMIGIAVCKVGKCTGSKRKKGAGNDSCFAELSPAAANDGMRVWDICIIIIMILGMVTLVLMSMVNCTYSYLVYGLEYNGLQYNIREVIYDLYMIMGVQGRYFIPFLILPFLLLPSVGIGLEDSHGRLPERLDYTRWAVIAYQVVAIVVTVVTLVGRYY